MIPERDRIQTTVQPSTVGSTLPVDFDLIRREAYAGVQFQDDAKLQRDVLDGIEAFEEHTGQYALAQTLEAVWPEDAFYGAASYRRKMPLEVPGIDAAVLRVLEDGTELDAADYRTNRRRHTGSLAVYPVASRLWSGREIKIEFTAGVPPGPSGRLSAGIENCLGVWTRYRATGEPDDIVLFYSLAERYMI